MITKPILILKNVACEGPGLIHEMLEAARIPFELDEYYLTQTDFDLTSYSAIIILGGPMSANDQFTFIQKEIQLIQKAHHLNLPLLGICLGSQLISKALGGEITQNPTKEIGVFEIDLSTAGKESALFQGLPNSFKIFQWHGETFSIPEGAKLLATSAACTHQAFQLGKSVGLQFHCEMTPEIVQQLVVEYADEMTAEGLATDELLSAFNQNFNSIKGIGEKIFAQFLKLL